jgi:hypothetical protein
VAVTGAARCSSTKAASGFAGRNVGPGSGPRKGGVRLGSGSRECEERKLHNNNQHDVAGRPPLHNAPSHQPISSCFLLTTVHGQTQRRWRALPATGAPVAPSCVQKNKHPEKTTGVIVWAGKHTRHAPGQLRNLHLLCTRHVKHLDLAITGACCQTLAVVVQLGVVLDAGGGQCEGVLERGSATRKTAA